ncbi:MAG: type II toxin-antitoxin system HicA family toxin [Microcystis viridis Mv_BB_P_19951000_S69]|uniref:Type II toxin-antitoxin system HicA family toxin n=1 Tax=Microcystis viridis Mv_BB_P_19951000_S68D TaxID=2486270 RepID=A0A552HKL3_MICVR|nr:MAG: type II toxin-antitoxin system HicA family toxin [Microcystis viridis Mv_BB_P_19951000_S68D]TRU72430.1 MAG: type II toxin-antitoxin system HicA family toxin [Microcystis viridis Mv_BB_P_19951000_S68]TRU77437.1 MAG: type II toxin-antitoxin system HicA family toxin [Microcystis viridis Mv_BB_P_19951000_S69]TRU88252.1 MAG: type II toxin-antitoxin system HicA family toxin [Microcystis viridis Mv_BB_P_19951000_S69D]
MAKFPVDAPKAKVIKVLEKFSFSIVREKEYISMIRKNSDGTTTPLTLPNHKQIKSSTLRSICIQAGISRDDFVASYEKT